MIVKKVKSNRTKGKAASIRDLTNYIREPQNRNPNEKVLYANGWGFISDTHAAQREEMVALAAEAVRSRNPVNHYILSWREGEQPSPEQVEEAVSIFLDELGLQEHQVIYALHKDTDNLHLHIAVNRVHPETLKCVEINKGFDLEAAHRAIARIEHAQGWQREQNGRYEVLENGELGREHLEPNKRRQPEQRKRDKENRTGEKSAERIAIEIGAPIIKQAQSWEQLHRELAAQGMRYEQKGSGALLWVGEVAVKASSADREASLGKLQKRLGAYEPAQAPSPVAQRKPEPLQPDRPEWEDFMAGRKMHYAEKNAAKLSMDQRQEQERKALQARQQEQRKELLGGRWNGKGEALNALRGVLAAEQAAEKAALKERHQQERQQWRQQYRPYPDFEQWLRREHGAEQATRWRYREAEPQRIEGDSTEAPKPRDIRAYQAEIVGQEVRYTPKSGAGGGPGGVSFVDKGRIIEIHDWRNQDTTLAALQLSAQKWGKFTVTGNDEYKALCVKLAAEHGFQITNPELQEVIRQERQRMRQERAQAMKSEQIKPFERYAEAVGAERYRVTSIKMRPDGSKQTFILDKRDGITRGFTPEEIAQRTPEMQRLQRRGENLYYTPLSEGKHHILIDDMDREKLDRLIRDGYQPAVVLESSPGNYQAVITIPKLGTVHDKDVGNRLSDALNREYGDPKLSGAIHPHRAPGYENRKPKHRREDGSYPEVRLLKAERRECGKTLALSREIDAGYQRQAAEKALKTPVERFSEPDPGRTAPVAEKTTTEAYWRHYRDVRKRQRGMLDLSRVDAMIAVRMRVTGFDQSAIEGAIYQCAPSIREQQESRDWTDYARRTARYAYSAAGDRQAADLGKYRQQWEKLEGRERQQEQAKAREIERNGPSMSR
ncbi:relaxase/mobilization nuclease domain-containing protein [Acidithiobacillus caldus]|uniref:TraI/MobA(P) family conjugative relaxase n=1 Tax=Acidithiobacillus caldus TaxID=33059 RepID=UPI001C07ED54|nr:TraI/MobA(P) family conjugative relaxase [Acidithiobacillus caldus]MBU2820306.1 relaxase/mobilization nuclease domain-containing protein [Acidithiobacillus caldus]